MLFVHFFILLLERWGKADVTYGLTPFGKEKADKRKVPSNAAWTAG